MALRNKPPLYNADIVVVVITLLASHFSTLPWFCPSDIPYKAIVYHGRRASNQTPRPPTPKGNPSWTGRIYSKAARLISWGPSGRIGHPGAGLTSGITWPQLQDLRSSFHLNFKLSRSGLPNLTFARTCFSITTRVGSIGQITGDECLGIRHAPSPSQPRRISLELSCTA